MISIFGAFVLLAFLQVIGEIDIANWDLSRVPAVLWMFIVLWVIGSAVLERGVGDNG